MKVKNAENVGKKLNICKINPKNVENNNILTISPHNKAYLRIIKFLARYRITHKKHLSTLSIFVERVDLR